MTRLIIRAFVLLRLGLPVEGQSCRRTVINMVTMC